ncbi:MAG: tetratricopeptide repeat protein [Cytophagales bacterium]|nr:tetratricopeptide repeat protein [Cytophagales bacterium]
MIKSLSLLSFFGLLLIGCSGTKNQVVEEEPPKPTDKQLTTLLGEPLPEKTFSDSTIRLDFENKLADAKANFEQYPDSVDCIIWYGRRLAYLGRHEEAIDVYSAGLKKFPEAYRLLRHRGHRYLTTRQIDKAIRDFGEAVAKSVNEPNAIEPDGLPNSQNIPLGNDKFNIWYHFGLAHYLNGRYDRAYSAYRQCMTFSDNDDLKAATSYWLYMAAVRSGSNTVAERTLREISTSWEMIENEAYMDLLLLFKGILSVDAILEKATGPDGTLNPTYGYGIGFHYLRKDQPEAANEIFQRALAGPSWESFGYIASEAEVSR